MDEFTFEDKPLAMEALNIRVYIDGDDITARSIIPLSETVRTTLPRLHRKHGRIFYTAPSIKRSFCSKSCSYKYMEQTEWDEQDVVKQIQTMKKGGEPLNAIYCRDNRLDLFKAAIRIFGSWNNALQASGIDFEKIRLDRKTSSYKGLIFENIVEELYRLSGISVIRKPLICGCQPDFVEENTGTWVDVKLRSWTVGIEKTIRNVAQTAELERKKAFKQAGDVIKTATAIVGLFTVCTHQ